MSKITNDGLTRSGRGCFIAVPLWQQWASKVFKFHFKLMQKFCVQCRFEGKDPVAQFRFEL